MRHFIVAIAMAAGIALPCHANAQELSVSAGATLTSRYLFNGIEQTTGAAFQPWVDIEYAGFYLGLWASNTSTSIVGSSKEVDVLVGYRNEIGKFSYDLGYARYYYLDPKVDCCGEVILTLGFQATDALGLGLSVSRDPVADYYDTEATIDYALTDRIGFSASYGTVSNGGQEYWSMGGSYAINDAVSLGGWWTDTDVSDGLFVVSLDTSFSLR